MSFNIIEEQNALIQDWIDNVERNYETLKNCHNLRSMKTAMHNLNLRMQMYYGIIEGPTKDLTMDIVKQTFGARKEIFNDEPMQYSFLLQGKEYNINREVEDSIEYAFQLFPKLLNAKNVFKRIGNEYKELYFDFFDVARKNIERLMHEQEQLVNKIEKRLEKSPPPMGEELVSLYTEILVLKKITDKRIKANTFDGRRLVEETKSHGISEKEITGEFPTQNQLDYHKIEVKLVDVFHEKTFSEEMQKQLRNLSERFGKIGDRFKAIRENSKYMFKILEVFDQINPEFPINLQRLSELVERDKSSTESILEYTLEIYPEIGKYDRVSQMLVFDKPDKVKKLVKKPKKKVKCPECSADNYSTENKCSNCGKKFDICPICRGVIANEEAKACSSCKALFHKDHIEEWMNTNRNCPLCKKPL